MKLLNKIFTLIFIVLLCILSGITVDSYDTLKEKQYDINRFINNNANEIQLYLFNIIENYDSDYKFIQIDGTDEKEDEVNYIEQDLNDMITYFSSNIKNDQNFQFVIKKNSKYISNENHLNPSSLRSQKSLFFSYMRYDENGNLTSCEGDICSYFQNNHLYDYIYDVNYSSQNYFDDSLNYYIHEDKITFNNPKNVELYLFIPYEVIPSGYVYHELTDSVDTYFIFISIFTLLAFVVLSIFIFITPIEKLNSINPYKTIKHWFIEWNLLLFGGLIILIGILAISLCKFTLDGTIEYLLNESYSQSFFIQLNFIVWAFFYYLLTIIPFLFKYSFTYGILPYLQNYTFLGKMIIKCKAELSNIKVNYRVIILTILAFVIPVIIGILVIYIFSEFGLFLILVGYIFLFISVLFIENKIYKQYKTLLDKTNQLSQGNFDIEINENLGLFEDYKKELLQVKDGFEKAVQEEVKSTNMKTELITNVSHDLKTPITCIKNYVTLLEDESLDKEKQKEYIDNLHQYTNRLTHLVEDLFEVSKVNSGNISLELVELNIVDFIKQVLAENNEVFENSNLTVITRFEDDHISCHLDSDKTYRIFENLITNIGKYALPYTRVYVDITRLNENVQITFKNISKDEMNFTSEEIVERFVRGDKSRHVAGSGLGLAIVKSYTEIQNGTFEIAVDGDLFKAILTFKESLISK